MNVNVIVASQKVNLLHPAFAPSVVGKAVAAIFAALCMLRTVVTCETRLGRSGRAQ